MLVDTTQPDATTEMYLKGDGIWVNSYLVSVMFALTGPGSRVLDLGGFVGEFALAAAAHGCEVVSVEANPEQARMLATSAELNRFDSLRVVHAAVGDRAGTVSFEPRGPYGQVVHGTPAGSDVDRVVQITVEDLVAALGWPSVDFLKIDIEGSESAALDGAARLLSAPDAPTLLIENNTFVLRGLSPDPAALLRQVEAFGYTLYLILPSGIWPWDANQFQPEVVCDFLAVKDTTSPTDAGLDVSPPLTVDEAAAFIANEIEKSPDHRIAMAWSLQFAPVALLQHPTVEAAVATLRADVSEDIRSEAGLIGSTNASAAPLVPPVSLHEELDGAWAAERVLRLSAEARLAIAAEQISGGPQPDAQIPGPRAQALARRISDAAERHPTLARIARRFIRPAS